MKRLVSIFLLAALMLVPVGPVVGAVQEEAKEKNENEIVDPAAFQALEYRLIGPWRGGRCSAVAGVNDEMFTFYMGTSGGGVWKTTDAGLTWKCISDGFFECGSIGAIAVAESDPNVIYVGTGETNLRGDVQTGVGMYKSVNAGATWTHIGLRETGQIGKIRVHPKNADIVYVAALGHAFGPNEERGVYRSTDGGETWEKVFFKSEKAGAVDLAMDYKNPRVLYAAIWQVVRQPWILESGGPDCGLYKSVDSGDTWKEVTNGLPKGMKGKIGVDISPVNSNRIWTYVEAEDGGIFRSDDGGKSFRLVNKERWVMTRPFYYAHIVADPANENTVYAMTGGFSRSIDGGVKWQPIRGPHGDYHALWINPEHPEVMVNGNDGGACVTFNGGGTWTTIMNQPTAEFYRVAVDNRFNYRVYGAQQDNSTISVSSERAYSVRGAVPDIYAVGGGEQGHIVVDPRDPDVVYAGNYDGNITRYDHKLGFSRNIEVYPQLTVGWPAEAQKFRFQMNAPIRISPHDPNILYHCSQHVHKSTDEGHSWTVISPDLTHNDKSKQKPTGGPITKDHAGGPENYCTIFSFEESPHAAGELWVGTDDGLMHLSRDGGATWEEITPPGMPEWGTVNTIELSQHMAGKAYVVVQRYRLDDFKPYVFVTADYGQSWKEITDGNGIDERHFVRVVREDPDRAGLLYAGTEFGMYISFDDGDHWQCFQLNLPVVQISDLTVHEHDLVVATHGRAFWILDDITPLHQLGDESVAPPAYLYQPRDPFNSRDLVVDFHLAGETEEAVKIEIIDAGGNVVRSFEAGKDKKPSGGFARFMDFDTRLEKPKVGMNRFEWNLLMDKADMIEGLVMWGFNIGPGAVPGNYSVRLSIGEWSQSRDFQIIPDPRFDASMADYQESYDLAVEVRDKITETHDALRTLRAVRSQVKAISANVAKSGAIEEIAEAAKELIDKLTAIEDKLTQTKSETTLDTLNFSPMLDNQLLNVFDRVAFSDTKPNAGVRERFDDLKVELAGHLEALKAIIDTDLAALIVLLDEKGIPRVIVPEK